MDEAKDGEAAGHVKSAGMCNDARVQQKGTAAADFASVVPFRDVVELYERVSRESKAQRRKALLTGFFHHYGTEDAYPLMRLLLPHLDRERGYQMKEATLARLLVEILGISERSEDGFRLVHWQRPTSNSEAGDFGNAVFLSLKNRCPEKGTLTVASLNAALDELSASTQRKERVAVMTRLLRSSTALEQKWIVRVILKELKIGATERTILGYFHPDACELFNATSDLKRVCAELRSPAVRLDGGQAGAIALFHPVRPMLASRHTPEEVPALMQGKPFCIETKYDGERIQIHKDGDRVEFFSRNCLNMTHIYGELLAGTVRERVTAAKCIVDGELLVWDDLAQRFEDFGKLKAFVGSTRGDGPKSASIGKQLCYVAFDVLFVNDRAIVELSLDQRTNILRRIINPKPRVIEVVEQRPAKTAASIVEALDAAILNREEGIMLKSTESSYKPGDRKGNWVKVKPEYLEGVGDDLDLLIVGGFFGKGDRRGGTISHFLLGISDTQNGGRPGEFLSFAKVGSGFSDMELGKMQEELKAHWRHFKPEAPPQFLLLGDTPGVTREKPDVWIEPQNSRVLQVKASQITPSDKYRAGVTLRFPRVVRVRTDKGWADATNMTEVRQIMDAFQGKYAKRALASANGGTAATTDSRRAKKQRRAMDNLLANSGTPAGERLTRTAPTLHGLYRDTDTSGVMRVSNALEGMELCILNGSDDHQKDELERAVVQHGGTKVQSPTTKTFCAIAARESVKVQNLVRAGTCDVVSVEWLLKCAEESKFVPLAPKYMTYSTPATREKLLLDFDRFGDSFSEDATPESLREVFAQVDRQLRHVGARDGESNASEPKLGSSADSAARPPVCAFDAQLVDVSGLEKHYWKDEKPWWSIFRGFVVYFDLYSTPGNVATKIKLSSLEPLVSVVKFFSATVVDRITPATTHIVIDPKDKSRLKLLKRIAGHAQEEPPHTEKQFVRGSWIEDSMHAREDLDEGGYSL